MTLFTLKQLSPTLKAAIVNTGWLFADRILRMGVGLFVSVWVARYLGVEQFGILNYAIAFVALFSTLSTLGLDGLVIRALVREPENRAEILGTCFWLKLLGGAISLLLAASSIVLARYNDSLAISLVIILAFSSIPQAFDTIDLWFQAKVKSKYTVFSKSMAFSTVAIVKIILIGIQAPLISFAWASLGEVFLGAFCLMITYKLKDNLFFFKFWKMRLAKTLLQESWPLILSGMAIMVYLRIDQIMLGQMIGDQAVGIYSAATRISEAWYFIPTAIASSITPAIYKAKEISDNLYYQRIRKLVKVLALIAFLVAVPVTVFSERIITILFGNSFTAAGPILAIHIWASLFVFLGVATSSWFIAEGLTHLSFRRTLIGAITNIFLNLFLIPTYGGVGAAIATVISYSIASVFANALDSRTWRIFVLQIQSIILIFDNSEDR